MGRVGISNQIKIGWVWWVGTILWCVLIFTQSHKPAIESDQQSLYIITVLNHSISICIGREVAPITNHLVRKAAHFIEYLILGVLLMKAFASSASSRHVVLYALLAGILYAGSDEIHQFFVPGRAMLIADVMLDSVGVLCGVALVRGVELRRIDSYAGGMA